MQKVKTFDIIYAFRPLWNNLWEFSSAGRASALQAGGRRFEPYNSHQFNIICLCVKRAMCGNGSVVERCLAKANVASSNLVSRSIQKQVGILAFIFGHMAPSPSGKAEVCKTFIPSSILGGASNICLRRMTQANNILSTLPTDFP